MTTSAKLAVASVQHKIVWENPAANFAALKAPIAAAAAGGAQLISLSEMYATGFSMQAEQIAEPLDGPSTAFLVGQAALHGAWLTASIPTIDPDFERPVNQLVVCNPDGVLGRYNKIHPFSFAGEDEHYCAGTDFLTLTLSGVRVTFFVCYDLRFANEFWTTGPNSDLFVVVANWPKARRHHWTSLLTARAIENQAYVLATNRVGLDGNGLAYAGDSMLIDPLGATLVQGAEAETVLSGVVDAGHVADTRSSFPFLQDRRP